MACIRPPSSYELAMPTKQRVRTNEERRPALAAQQPAGRGQEYAVGLLQPRPGDLAAQNGQLVPEHHDLKLLEPTRAKAQPRDRKRATEQQIHKRDQQEAPSTRWRTGSTTLWPDLVQPSPEAGRDGFTYPTRWRPCRRRRRGRPSPSRSRVAHRAELGSRV